MSLRWLTLAALSTALLIPTLSCNIFAPSSANREDYAERRGWEAVVLEGKIEMREGHWVTALRMFNYALDKSDSASSEALFYSGKCYLRMAGIDLTDVWDQINPNGGVRDPNAVPFLYKSTTRFLTDSLAAPFNIGGPDTAYTVSDSVFLDRKNIYDAICKAIKSLEFIYYNPGKVDGIIVRKQYESDYLVEIGVRSVLGLMDLNNNGVLDWADSLGERAAFRIICSDIPSLDDMSFDSLKAISTDPGDINAKLDELYATVLKADSSYSNFTSELRGAKMDTSTTAGLGSMIGQFRDVIPYFYYDDAKDNNGNYFNTDSVWDPFTGDRVTATGRDNIVDRMIWIDWDQDRHIDINGPAGPHMHIGEDISMFPNGKDPSKPYFGLDTTLYTLVEMFPYVDSCNFMLLSDGSRYVYRDVAYSKYVPPPSSRVRDTIDAPAYGRYIYKGSYTHEFIFGDWGVDEEIMEGKDNTYDKLTDEDSRAIDDTLDNDGDRSPAGGAREKMPPMVWEDRDQDFQIDWPCDDTVRVLKIGKYLALARIIQAENTALYPFPGDPRRDRTVLADSTILLHRCASGGEFVSGTAGEDEEWYDGIDNDGDGLIDEDVSKTSAIPPESMRRALIDRLVADHEKLHTYWTSLRRVK